MMVRGVVGVVLFLLGGLWIGQGTGAVKGSAMTGHSQYAVLGAVVVALGVALMVWAWRVRGRRDST